MLSKQARRKPPASFRCAQTNLHKRIVLTLLISNTCLNARICDAAPSATANSTDASSEKKIVKQAEGQSASIQSRRSPGHPRRSAQSEESEPNYVPATMEYDEIIDPSKRRSISALISAEMALRSERVDRSIQLARRAMKRDPDDLDVHKALAEALDRKLEYQTDKDPKVFEECVREWLIVLRNGVGMEKGTNFKGLGVFDSLFGDEDTYIIAKQRLKHLTGYVPKPWETNEKYLKRVLRPAEASIKGRILKKAD